MEPRTITVEGLRTRILEAGGGSSGRDPIVLIHGVGGWAENWRAVMRPLATTGRHVVALDLPGFGESEPPRRVRYFDPDEPFYPRFVLSAMDALGMPRAHIVGNSMGGAIAYMVAVTAPTRTRSMVLVAPGGLGRDVAFFLRACALPGFGLVARLPRPSRAAREVLRTCFHDARRITTELYDEAERYGNNSFPEFIRALSAGVSIRGVRRSLRDAWVARSSRYGGPALVVWGREDLVLPLRHLADVHATLPQAQVHVIERCGHLAMAERPDEFLAASLPFLDRAEEAAAA
ncbi:MAG TPA: alpha/beta fold hydrolase [Candidatus Limnocylindria bacterium]|jgi:pimeloyl-ACP methyl ester carboxylesterase|nr:alpha/beta fold hydrolase [Candidatus Limnocylindria bacterium]